MKAATLKKRYKERFFGISIHAAREGGDRAKFLRAKTYIISIHAAREGGDETYGLFNYYLAHFNPRRP